MFVHKLLFFCCIVLLIVSGAFFYPRWQKGGTEAQISWDAGGYYWYLPSTFIYKDIKGQKFKDSIMQKYGPLPPNDFQYGAKANNGNYVMKYTLGTAILEAPWFFVAHIVAEPLGYDADGFSRPYQFMIYLGGILFSILGLFYLRRLLLYYYSQTVVSIVLVLLVFGTNYLNYAGIDVGMTHSWLFTLYVLIMYCSHHFYKTFSKKYLIYLGVLVGIASLVRPPEIISAFIPMLWGINDLKITTIKGRMAVYKRNIGAIILAVCIAAFVLSFQFIYWKHVSDSWFVYSYQEQGFSWRSPHFSQYALNFQCGWLVYTPMMLFAIVGIIPFLMKGKNRIAIVLLILLNYYIVAAWDMWDYGGRAMIQNYPILIFPLASLWQWSIRHKWVLIVLLPSTLVALYANLWWTYQAHGGGLIGDVPATKKYYLKTIFRYNVPLEYQKLRDSDDLYTEEIKNAVLLYASDSTTFDGKPSIVIVDSVQYKKQVLLNPTKKFKWIRAYADFRIEERESNVWYMTQFFLAAKKGTETIRSNQIRTQRLMNPNSINTISIDAFIDEKDFDQIELNFRNDNNGKIPCKVSNIRVVGFNQ